MRTVARAACSVAALLAAGLLCAADRTPPDVPTAALPPHEATGPGGPLAGPRGGPAGVGGVGAAWGVRADAWLEGAAILASDETPPDARGRFRRVRIVEHKGFKYPYLRVEESLRHTLLGTGGWLLLQGPVAVPGTGAATLAITDMVTNAAPTRFYRINADLP